MPRLLSLWYGWYGAAEGDFDFEEILEDFLDCSSITKSLEISTYTCLLLDCCNCNYSSLFTIRHKIHTVKFAVLEARCKNELLKSLNVTLRDSAVKNKM